MNPKFYTYFLPSLHGQFFGSYPLIPFLKALTRVNFFNSKGTIYQIKSKMPYVGVESMAEKIKRAHKWIIGELKNSFIFVKFGKFSDWGSSKKVKSAFNNRVKGRNNILKQKEKNELKYHQNTSIHEIRSCTDDEISKKNQHVNVSDDTGFSSFYYKKVFMILISHIFNQHLLCILFFLSIF